jgi:hypothetical protein
VFLCDKNECFKINGYDKRYKQLTESTFTRLSTKKVEEDGTDYNIVNEDIIIMNIESIMSNGEGSDDDIDELFYELSTRCIFDDLLKIEKDIKPDKQGGNTYTKIALFNISYWEDYYGEGDSRSEFKGFINSFNNQSIIHEECIASREEEESAEREWINQGMGY